MMNELDARLHRIGQHHFRAKFRLGGPDRAVVDLRGITTVRRHAKELSGQFGAGRKRGRRRGQSPSRE